MEESSIIFANPEILWFLPFALILLFFVLFLKKKRRKWLDFLLCTTRCLLVSALFVVLANPVEVVHKTKKSPMKKLESYLYFDLLGLEQNYEKIITDIIRKHSNLRIIGRINNKLLPGKGNNIFALLRDEIRNSTPEKTLQNLDSLAVSFNHLENDISQFTGENKKLEIYFVGLNPLNEIQENWLKSNNISWEYTPLSLVGSEPDISLIRLKQKPMKPYVGEDFEIILEFNENVGLESLRKLQIFLDNSKVDFDPESIISIDNSIIEINQEGLQQPGIHKLSANYKQFSITEFFHIRQRPSVFLIAGDEKAEITGDKWLIEIFNNAHIDYKISRNLPDELWHFNAGIIRFVKLIELSDNEYNRLTSWVKSGGGLLVSFGQEDAQLASEELEKFKDFLPAEPVLLKEPVNPDVKSVDKKDKDKEIARVSLILMIDNSGSMAQNVGGLTRSQYVKEAAKKAIDSLSPTDLVGIFYFDETDRVSLPLTPLTNKEKIYEAINKIPFPKGMTSIVSACRKASLIFKEDRSAVKQLLILSDGEETKQPLYNFNKERENFERNNINCSVIGFGDYNPEKLKPLITKKGKSYFMQPGEMGKLGFYKVKLAQFMISDVDLARNRLEDWRKNNKKIDKEKPFDDNQPKVKLQSVIIGNYEPKWGFNPFSNFKFLPGKVKQFIELSTYPDTYTILNIQDEDIEYSFINARNYGRGKIVGYAADFTAEFVPAWFDWKHMQNFVRSLLVFLRSPYYQGVRIHSTDISFHERLADKEILTFKIRIQKQNKILEIDDISIKSANMDNEKKIVYFDNQEGQDTIDIEFNKSRSELKDIAGFEISRNKQPFAFIKIPNYLRINYFHNKNSNLLNRLSDIKQGTYNTKSFKAEFNKPVSKNLIPQKRAALTLISILLIFSIVLFILDIFFKR